MGDLLKGADTTGRIKALIAAKGVTIKQLAELLGVSEKTVYNRMAANSWKVEDLRQIAATYGVNPEDLL